MIAEVASLDLANKLKKNKTKRKQKKPKQQLCTLVNWRGRVFLSQLAGEVSGAVHPMPTTLSFSHPWTLHQAQEPPLTAGLQ